MWTNQRFEMNIFLKYCFHKAITARCSALRLMNECMLPSGGHIKHSQSHKAVSLTGLLLLQNQTPW